MNSIEISKPLDPFSPYKGPAIIISLSGPKRSGKNTVADLMIKQLCEHHPDNMPLHITDLSFAEPLKEEVCELLDITDRDLNEHKDVFRPLLQWYGTEWIEYLGDKDRWIDLLAQRMDAHNNAARATGHAPVIIITDTRLEKEGLYLSRLKKMGFFVQFLCIQGRGEEGDAHRSEQEWRKFPFDHMINNFFSIDHLKKEVLPYSKYISNTILKFWLP